MSQDGRHHLPIGIGLQRPSPRTLIEAAVQADEDGLPAVWSTVVGTSPAPVTAFAAAAVRTRRVGLGTSVVPTYPRHPVTLASQVLIFADLAPGRFRLGIGPSERPNVEGMFAAAGFPVGKDGTPSDELVAEVVITGDARQVVQRLHGILKMGPDELLVTLLRVGDAAALQRALAKALQ